MADIYEADFDEAVASISPQLAPQTVQTIDSQLAERASTPVSQPSSNAAVTNIDALPMFQPHSALERHGTESLTLQRQPEAPDATVTPSMPRQQLRIVQPSKEEAAVNRNRLDGPRNRVLKQKPTGSSAGVEFSGSPGRRTRAASDGVFVSPTPATSVHPSLAIASAGAGTGAGTGATSRAHKLTARQSSTYVAPQSALPAVAETDPSPPSVASSVAPGLASSRATTPLAHAAMILSSLQSLVSSSLATAAAAHAAVLSPGAQTSAPFNSSAAATAAAHGFNELQALLRDAQGREKEWLKKEKSWAEADKLWQDKFHSAREQSSALLAAREKAVAALTNKVSAVQAQNDRLKAAVHTTPAGERLHELENVKREKDMIIARLTEEVKALQTMNRQLARKLDESEAAVGRTGLPVQLDTLNIELKGERDRGKRLRSEFAALEEAHRRQGEQVFRLAEANKALKARSTVSTDLLAPVTTSTVAATTKAAAGAGRAAVQIAPASRQAEAVLPASMHRGSSVEASEVVIANEEQQGRAEIERLEQELDAAHTLHARDAQLRAALEVEVGQLQMQLHVRELGAKASVASPEAPATPTAPETVTDAVSSAQEGTAAHDKPQAPLTQVQVPLLPLQSLGNAAPAESTMQPSAPPAGRVAAGAAGTARTVTGRSAATATTARSAAGVVGAGSSPQRNFALNPLAADPRTHSSPRKSVSPLGKPGGKAGLPGTSRSEKHSGSPGSSPRKAREQDSVAHAPEAAHGRASAQIDCSASEAMRSLHSET